MSQHNYENTLGTSYLEGGRYRDRIKYQDRHSKGKSSGVIFFMWLLFVELCLMRSFGELTLFVSNIKNKFAARVNAPKWILAGGSYVILAMMATTIFSN